MSYGSEWLAEYTYEREQARDIADLLYARAEANASRGLWITKDGRYLSMHDMTTSHIQNCIRMLERNYSVYKEPYIQAFEKELAERGEK